MLSLIGITISAVFRDDLVTGRTFREGDAELLAPPIMVSEFLWTQLGSPTVDTHPVVELGGDLAGTYQLVGVLKAEWEGSRDPIVRMLWDFYRERAELPEGTTLTRYVWVNEDSVDEIGPLLAADLRQGLPADTTLSAYRSDWMAYGPNPGAFIAQLVVGGVAAMVLLLAALGLVNVQLVAMRQRVREIGVRRAFGASQARLFTTVLLESLVATTVAGVLGVAIVVAALRAGVVGLVMPGVQDLPPVPYLAAFIGLGASVLIGALAGLVPATVAVRVKVIDAIRF
ncbi:ABC transporter permease [Microbacterium sp. NC79]|uniref:ABC transporter permease n=1 Tax=Microbacterium sp. NC79 TaxID=2851009 RepID=UPI0020B6AAA9|nr:FtsX-like permease family protein [Microbacterium sp. NC79]